MDYQQNENYDFDYDPNGGNNSSSSVTNGLKIAVVILLVVLAAVSFLYWQSVRKDRLEIDAMELAKDSIQNEYGVLLIDMDSLKFTYDTTNMALNQELDAQRFIVDSLMGQMQRERNISYSKIRAYEKELGTLRLTMQGFVRQIDSLNQLNQKLTSENLNFRREISTLRTTTEAAEETAAELNSKIERGAIVKVRDVKLTALKKNNSTADRARQATQLVTNFVLAANELALLGEKTVYVRIINPQGFDMADTQQSVFEFEGSVIPYAASRVLDYQGEDLAATVYYPVSDLEKGQYTVHVYMDELLVGTATTILK